MKGFIKKILFIIAPVLLWGIIIILVDPFCYFNYSMIKKDFKRPAKVLNTLLYNSIDYMKFPCENIIIGDSRAKSLSIKLIDSLTNEKWKQLTANAAKLNEIFDLFYLANERIKLKRVIITINFNMFNEYGYMDRVSGIRKILKNPLMYIYNKNVAEAAYYILKSLIIKKKFNSTPSMSKEEFWKWNISTKATHWYGKYKFPTLLYEKMIELDEFTRKNNIEVILMLAVSLAAAHVAAADLSIPL